MKDRIIIQSDTAFVSEHFQQIWQSFEKMLGASRFARERRATIRVFMRFFSAWLREHEPELAEEMRRSLI